MFLKFNANGTFKEVLYVCLTFSSYILIGINRSYLTFLFYQLDAADSFIQTDNEEKSWIAACTGLLSPVGSLIGGILMDVYGRKTCVQIMFLPFLVSWIMITFARNVRTLYIANLIQSLGIGMCNCTATYISEIVTAEHRGGMLGVSEIPYNFGILVCYQLMYYVKWNTAAIVFSVLCVLFSLLTFALPESPSWLYLKGFKEKAMDTLTNLRNTQPENLELERLEMENEFASANNKTRTSCVETLNNIGKAWKPFLIVTILMVLQQNTGYNVMTAYFIMIVDDLRTPYASANVALWYSVASAASSFLTPWVMHKYGRKATFSTSAFGMGLCVATLAIYQALYSSCCVDQTAKPFAWIVPLTLCLYVLVASMGVLPVGFTMVGEIFPNESRGILNGIFGVFSYLYRSLVLKVYPDFLSRYGAAGTMRTFCAFSMVSVLYGLFVLPETKGKTLKQVQEQYFKKSSKAKNKA